MTSAPPFVRRVVTATELAPLIQKHRGKEKKIPRDNEFLREFFSLLERLFLGVEIVFDNRYLFLAFLGG
jgi:hypothetical protein